jgi:arylsulfatase A-like enzyme
VNSRLISAIALLFTCAISFAADRPNILFIMSDDHAAHAISAYGSKVNYTPNIDRIAKEGIRLDRCYAVNSICTPSRATILTGQYSHKNGVPVFNSFDRNRDNVAKRLKAAGYQTAMIGKWHLGSDPSGFDYWQILPGQGAYWRPILYGTDGEKTYQGHATDVVTDISTKWLDNRKKDQPFFLMMHHKAPHRNWQPQERFAQMWTNKNIPVPPTLFASHQNHASAIREQKQSIARDLTPNDLKATPPEGLAGDDLTRWKYQRYMQDYLACVQGVDDSIGKILKYLADNNLEKNTLIIYTSDQGFFLGDHGMYDKRFMYEESSRMPFVARLPGTIKPGSTSESLVINCDFSPTFLELAGAKIPADIQGRSMLPVLRAERPADWRKSFYYRYYHEPGHHNTRQHYGVRTDTHKLIFFPTINEWECFDLILDPSEMRNIYNDPAAQTVVAKLKTELARLKKEVADTEDLYQDPATWPKGTADVQPPSRRARNIPRPNPNEK